MNSILLLNSFLSNFTKTKLRTNDLTNINEVMDLFKEDKNNIIKNFDLNKFKNNLTIENPVYFENTTEENTYNREYKDICTDIVNEDILDYQDLYNFLYIISSTYIDVINDYIKKKNLKEDDIIFVFKGGNIFKLIGEQFWNYLPGKAAEYVIENYKDYLKRSDIDFTIYINPKLKEFNLYFEELTYISYLTQILIRKILNHNKSICFTWFRYNKIFKQKILLKWLEKLKTSKSITDDTNKFFYNNEFYNISLINDKAITSVKPYIKQKDKITEFTDNRLNKIQYEIDSIDSNFLYTTINKALEFSIGDLNTKFNLVRTKINFNMTMIDYKTNENIKFPIGGELIDVSIGHKGKWASDKELDHLFDNKNKYLKNIQWKNQQFNIFPNKITKFYITCYSLEYINYDVSKILFKTVKYPWHVRKYKKRLYRLFYTCIVDLFMYGDLKEAFEMKYIKLIQNFLSNCFNILKKIKKKRFFDKDKKNLELLLKVRYKVINKLSTLYSINHTFFIIDALNNYFDIFEYILYKYNYIDTYSGKHVFPENEIDDENKNDNINGLHEYLFYIINNINNIYNIIDNIKTYCQDSGAKFNYDTYDSMFL